MDATPYMPIIVEATKFVFNEVGKWLEHARQRSGKTTPEPSEDVSEEKGPKLTQQDFAALAANPVDLLAAINVQKSETDAYVIKGLVDQIQTHRRNLIDLEATETEYGALTPQHVKRAIEREASGFVEKSQRLKNLLEQIYGRKIEDA